MQGYRNDALIEQRAKTFALWLAHEAKAKPILYGIQQTFFVVGKDVDAGLVPENAHIQLLYGGIRGHAMAWGYIEDFEKDPRLYLSHYIVAVMERRG